MANKTVSILQSGTNNFLTSAAALNAYATDFFAPGVVSSFTNTSGVAPMTGSFAVNAQGTPNMTVAVSSGQGYVSATPTGGVAQTVRVASDATENVTIAANSSGSTKWDFLYIKVDPDKMNNPAVTGTDVMSYIVQRSTSGASDTNGAPSNSILLAIITVGNGVGSIINGNIMDSRTQSYTKTIATMPSEGFFDFVASGCVWTGDSYGSNSNASMTAGVIYLAGKRVTVSAVSARTFTASKDTYVDVDNTGALYYSEVTNNATSPSLTAGRLRVAIIVTGASNIANAGSINQGQFKALLPVVSSNYLVFSDSNGKPICNRQPYGPIKTSSNNWKILDFGSYKEYTQSFTNVSFAATTTAQSVWTGNAPTGITTLSDIDQIFLGASSTNYGGEMTFAVEQIASGTVYITAAGTRSNTHNYTCHVKLVKYL